jgi:hypothetical protein
MTYNFEYSMHLVKLRKYCVVSRTHTLSHTFSRTRSQTEKVDTVITQTIALVLQGILQAPLRGRVPRYEVKFCSQSTEVVYIT